MRWESVRQNGDIRIPELMQIQGATSVLAGKDTDWKRTITEHLSHSDSNLLRMQLTHNHQLRD